MVSFKRLALSGLVAMASAKSFVQDLTSKNFEDVVYSGKPTLVKFFAPWCGHCKTLAPVYEELAHGYSTLADKINIAKVDAEQEKTLGKKFKIGGFPTLKFFTGKKDDLGEEYTGERSLENLKDYISDKTGVTALKQYVPESPVVQLTADTFEEEVGGDRGAFVAFTAPWCGHCQTLAPIWEVLANDFKLDNVLIGKVNADDSENKELAQSQGAEDFPTIKWFAPNDKKGIVYSGSRTEKAFVEFINEKAGTHREAGGVLNTMAGTVAELDALVQKYLNGDKISSVIEQVNTESSKFTDQVQITSAKYYQRVLEKMNTASDYATKEYQRLSKILAKGGLSPFQRDEMTKKKNVLSKFIDKATGKDEL